MNRLIAILILSLAGICASAQSAATVQAYIDRNKATALKFEKEYGIPAAISMAQGILESGAGTSSLTHASNNHFCIKAGSSWTGATYKAKDDEPGLSTFRSYASAEDSWQDYAKLISTSSYYASLFSINVYDYRGWAFGLKKCGYASTPNYAQALIGLIDAYQLYAINGGVKLRPGKTVVITHYEEVPVFDEECVMADDEESPEEEQQRRAIRRYVVEINNLSCTVLQPGETIYSVARKYNIEPADLIAYNELTSKNQLDGGDIIFLEKKKKKFTGSQDFYYLPEDMTLHKVSQEFGMQLAALAKLNSLSQNASLSAGTRIKLK